MSDFQFVKYALDNGGTIKPLLIPSDHTNGTGLCNPAILVDDGRVLVNLRHIQYTLYHSELNKYEHQYGPLAYLNPENDNTLTTTYYLCVLNAEMDIQQYHKVDTSKFDKTPLWEFVGLEDARLMKWEGKYFLAGVRRDLDSIGTGRMEMSELDITPTGVREVNRTRIPAPAPDQSYCEKNWVPVEDKPWHFVKWTNPTELVKVNLDEPACETVFLGEHKETQKDLRGGSQIIPFRGGYLGVMHETNLFKSEAGRKNAIYRHRFTVWDKNFNIIKFSKEFTFLNTWIEFSCGMTRYGNEYLITFGVQDNAAFILRVPEKVLEDFIDDNS